MSVMVNKGELDALNSISYQDILKEDAASSASLGNLLDEFKNSNNGGTLKGHVWDQCGEKIAVYNNALARRQQVAAQLGETISSCTSKLLAAWDDRFGEEMTTEFIPELKEELKKLENQLAELKAKLAELDEDDEEYSTIKGQISNTEAAKTEVELTLKAAEHFEEVYGEVMGELEEAKGNIESSFKNVVTAITPSPQYAFTPSA